MCRLLWAAAVAAATSGLCSCGAYGDSSMPSPSGPSAPPADAVVIDIVGVNGARSFSRNPAAVPAGRPVVWHNVDGITHHVVLNNGALDTGRIAPGEFSAAMMLPNTGPYHCSIHPSMVGTIAVTQ
jgi:plastocyanin